MMLAGWPLECAALCRCTPNRSLLPRLLRVVFGPELVHRAVGSGIAGDVFASLLGKSGGLPMCGSSHALDARHQQDRKEMHASVTVGRSLELVRIVSRTVKHPRHGDSVFTNRVENQVIAHGIEA